MKAWEPFQTRFILSVVHVTWKVRGKVEPSLPFSASHLLHLHESKLFVFYLFWDLSNSLSALSLWFKPSKCYRAPPGGLEMFPTEPMSTIFHKVLFRLRRSRNILETWKVRSPCSVHKHSKHRRTPLYLLELAVWVGRGRRRGWFCSHCQTKSAFLVLSLRPQGGALRALDPEDQNTI